ncbi:MAG: polysaccharide deacetylase family protein [Alphaproteobacteria bacterium]|nr:polysaccharide deacetylase family protein [Alphaproteobacteria bacterium]
MAVLASGIAGRPASLADGTTADALPRVAVTFDDGYRDNLRIAAPVLNKHQIPFTVFVCTGFMRDGSGNFLAPAEVRELAAMPGVTIGSHGATHTPLTNLNDRTLHTELVASKSELENITGREVAAISYPHGAVDRRVRAAAAAAGYKYGACSRFDINAPNRDPLLLCRTDIHAGDSLRVFKQKLHGDWDWYKWRNRDPAH